MKVTYRLNRKDIFWAPVEQLFHQPIFVVFLGLIFALISYENWQAISPTRTIFVRVFTFIVMELIPTLLLATVLGLFFLLNAISKKNNVLLMEQSITLGNELFVCQSEYVRSEVKWPAVQRIIRTRGYLYIYVSQMGAILVPRRAFATQAERDSFEEFCRAVSQRNRR